MRRYGLIWMAVAAMALPSAWGQAFPFEDAFTDYAPGNTGAPAWSILGGSFHTEKGALNGPVTIRFNARPPHLYVADLTLAFQAEAGPEVMVALNHQHDADTVASDVVLLRSSGTEVNVVSGVERTGEVSGARMSVKSPATAGPISLRIVMDADAGRHAIYLDNKPLVTGAALEYAAGLFSVRLGEGASLDRIVLRAPTADEKRSLMISTLLNDPRDAADGDAGSLLVLHRGSPAVLTITPDGEVTRTFGRRAPGGIPDAVALARGPRGEVLVLNRFPGEVVVFERNGGIRHRFGKGLLREPSDIAVMPDGTTYISDPPTKAVSVFAPDHRHLGTITAFGGAEGTPVRLGHDTFRNLVVMLDKPARMVTLRPGADRVTMALVSQSEAPVSDVVAAGGRLFAYQGETVVEWGQSEGATYHASSVGGLEAGGRLALVGDTVYALDRRKSRLVAVPATLTDTEPSIFFQNLAQSTALVRWTSAQPSLEARVRVGYDGRSVSEKQVYKEPTTGHQVPITGLKPGRTYLYAVSPTSATIPPTDWSTEYSFTTDAVPVGGIAPPLTEKTGSAP